MRANVVSIAISASLIALGLTLATPDRCLACSCAEMPTPVGGWTRETLTAGSEAVFSGTVVAVTPVETFAGGVTNGQYTVLFRVDEVWTGSGNVGLHQAVVAGGGGGDCTIPFALGESWLIYGSPDAGKIGTGICNRTARLAGATDLDTLGAGERPGIGLGLLPLIGPLVDLSESLVSLQWR